MLLLALLVGSWLVLLGAVELGFRLGKPLAPGLDANTRSIMMAVNAALLGLLGLLVAFSYSMAAGRFDSRRNLVIDEANAMGTAYLRAGALAEPDRTSLRRELRAYIDARLAYFDAGGDESRTRDAQAKAEASQLRCWGLTMAAARQEPRSVTTGLLLQSLNEMIDLDTKRGAEFGAHVPPAITELVIAIAFFGMVSVGCCNALAGNRNLVLSTLLVVSVASVIFVNIDLDQPQRGLIQVSQNALHELRDRIDRYSP